VRTRESCRQPKCCAQHRTGHNKLRQRAYQRAIEIENAAVKTWTDAGGELIKLPAAEQAEMIKTMGSVGADLSKDKPALAEAFKIVTDAVQRGH